MRKQESHENILEIYWFEETHTQTHTQKQT